MAVTDYNGKEKASLKNIKALWQYITGGCSGHSQGDGSR